MNEYWLLLKGTFLSKPWKRDYESRRKTFFLFVCFYYCQLFLIRRNTGGHICWDPLSAHVWKSMSSWLRDWKCSWWALVSWAACQVSILKARGLFLWEGILQREMIYFQHNLLDFLPSIKSLLGWQNFWKVPGRMSSPSDTGQAPNTLAIPLSVGPCCLCFADENEFQVVAILQHTEDWHLWTANSAQEV